MNERRHQQQRRDEQQTTLNTMALSSSLCFSILLSYWLLVFWSMSSVEAFQATTTIGCRFSSTATTGTSRKHHHYVQVVDCRSTVTKTCSTTTPSRISTRLHSVAQDDKTGSSTKNTGSEVDVDAIVKYAFSIIVQMSLIYGLFLGLDNLVAAAGLEKVPFPILFVGFYALSLKSRVFNPLNNDRPDMQKAVQKGQQQSAGFGDRNMPSWTPPGVVFPIVWILINAPLRAYSSSLVYLATGHFTNAAIMAFVLHLSVGDVWNTVNNTEKRYGASVTAVAGVWATALYAALQYYQVDPLAGQLLGGTCLWLTVAATLVTATWRMNPINAEGTLDKLYPVVGEAKTDFSWFGGEKVDEDSSNE